MRLQGISRGPFVIAVLFSSTALAIGVSQYAFGHFIAPLEERFGWTPAQIGVSLSFLAVGGLAAPLFGRAMDRFGARPILVSSLVLFGISFCLRPLMSELWHLYALSLLQFIPFAGLTLMPAGRLIPLWYPRMRGRIMGIATMGNNIGGLVMPILIVVLLTTMSWAHASVVIGLLSFLIAAAAHVIVREAPPATEGSKEGASARSMAPESTKADPEIPETPEIRESADPRAAEAQARRSFYAVLITLVLGAFAYSVFLPHVYRHLEEGAGLSTVAASFAFGVLAVGGACGKFIFGWMAERFGAKSMTMLDLIGQAIAGGLIAFVPMLVAAGFASPGSVAVLAGIYGFFLGGFGVLMPLIVQEISDPKRFGSVMGWMQLGQVVSFGLGPLIAGRSDDLLGSYTLSFLLTCAFFVIGALSLIWCASPPRPRARGL